VGALLKEINGSSIPLTELVDTELGFGENISRSVCNTPAFFYSIFA
jgi:hypothetical protein